MIYFATAAAIAVAAVSCTGRTTENMEPLGETVTVEIDTVCNAAASQAFPDADDSVSPMEASPLDIAD